MKIGLVSRFLPEKDGIAIYSDNLLRGFNKNKNNITTIGRKGNKADYTVDFKSFFLKEQLENIIKRKGLDIIHIQYIAPFFSRFSLNYNLIRALKLSVPVVVTLHEVHYSTDSLKNKVLARIEKQIVKRADKIIAHTPGQKEFLEKKYQADNVICIYHGMRLNQIPKRKKEKSLLCFGMISQGKGIPYLIKAMKHLPDYNLVIAGKFVDKRTEEEVTAALKKSANIKTDFGWIKESKKERYYKEANIVVLPHIWAPYQSGILHNSVAWGLPVVVAKTGAIYEVVELFKFGEVVNPKSPKALAGGIKKVFANYNKYKKGLTRYREEANWASTAKKHYEAFKCHMKNI